MKRKITERREYSRFDILEYAQLRRGDGHSGTCVIVDVSLGGLQIRTREPLVPGDQCQIAIGRGGIRPLTSKVEVRYVNRPQDSDLFSAGLRFLPCSSKERVAMVDYIHEIFRRQGETLLSD